MSPAHATSPNRGMGANTAIRDAADLAHAFNSITATGEEGAQQLQKALEKWEVEMVERGVEVVKSSIAITKVLHATGYFTTHFIRPFFMRFIGMVSSWGQPRQLD